MVQWLKHLSHNPEDLSSDPQDPQDAEWTW